MKPVKNKIEEIREQLELHSPRRGGTVEEVIEVDGPEHLSEGPLCQFIRQHPQPPGRVERVEYRWVEDDLVPWRVHDRSGSEIRPGGIVWVRNTTSIQETTATQGGDSGSDLPDL